MSFLQKLINEGCIVTFQKVFANADTHENIYKIETNRDKILKKIIKHEPVSCDCEKFSADSNYFLSNNSLLLFDKAYLRSSDDAYSGKYSLKLTKDNPYGLDTKFTAQAGFYEITVMRKSEDQNGFIVASESSTSYYRATGYPQQIIKGWERINLTLLISGELIGKPISLYLWYPGNGFSYFDNLKIVYYEVK
jgi:hypothetical protein